MLNPKILGIRSSMLLYTCGRRLRLHTGQELLAGSGIAVGVALVFGVLVANASLTSSAGELIHQVVGSARLELAARSSAGFDQRLATTVGKLPGVQASAAVLRENIAVVGPHGRQSVQLLGLTGGVVTLGSLGTRDFGENGLRFAGGLLLPSTVANAIGAEPSRTVTVLAAGAAHTIRTSGLLDSSLFGALASSPVAISLLPTAQRLTGHPRRVTLILVRPRRGADRLVKNELTRLAAGRLDVLPADNELHLLDEAAKPNDQSTSLFSAISVMVGFLLALCAMLLTVPERRRFTADLRMQGYDRRQVLLLLGFQALMLGVVASLVGIALGDLLSRAFFQAPAYLTAAFPIGTRQRLHAGTVVLALGSGVLATLLASLSPAFDLRPSRAIDAALRDTSGGSEAITRLTALKLGVVGAGLIAIATVLVLAMPGLTIFGGVALAVSTLLLIPAMFIGVSHGLPWISERIHSSALVVAVSELRAITARSIAFAGIAGLAVYGNIAVGGARADLIRGLDVNFNEYLSTADIWVTTGGNDLTTNSFIAGGAPAAIAHAAGIASVRLYQGGLLDVGPRRLWIIARPPTDSILIQASQMLHGNLTHATRLLRQGGWAAVSGGFAGEHHLRVGDSFLLPTPSGAARFGVAAITTNLGWPPGAIILTNADYQRYWQSTDPTALEINLQPGVAPEAGRRSVERALGRRPGLGVQTLHEREAQYATDSRQGLQALGEISTLLLSAAALAVASALSAAIWQRRARLASLKIQGYDYRQLWLALLLESAVMLVTGGAVGAVNGVYGHALASRWLNLTTGFPAPFSVGLPQVALTLALVAGIALVVIALPGLLAARVPPRASLHE
jgi:putative ABC transport system permease protein